MVTIGELARRTGCKVQTIRYYEDEGLLPPPQRTAGNQRRYPEALVKRLAFIRHARALGFSLAAIKELIALSDEPAAPCERADRIAREQLVAVERKIEQLEVLRRELGRMVSECGAGRVAECRVIEVLADHSLCESDHPPA